MESKKHWNLSFIGDTGNKPAEIPTIDGWEHIGHIPIDSGLCLIGDNCYIGESDKNDDLDEYTADIVFGTKANEQILVTENGLGLLIRSDDGQHNVFAKYKDGRVAELKIVFIKDTENGK